jgi:predicted RNA binding protein YcfA (HicA-like mRNA interferase family)
MPKLPILTANELIAILKKIGFDIVRQEGSHVFMRHADGRTTVIPNHPGEDLDRGLMNKILKKDLSIDRDEFIRLV